MDAYEHSYGIIPFYKDENGLKVLVIYQYGSAGDLVWTFPKGKHEEGEEPLTTAHRELREETGLEADVLEDIEPLCIEYSFERKGVHVDKVTRYFLGFAKTTDVALQNIELKDAKWLSPEDAYEKITFEGHKKLLKEALVKLSEHKE